MADRFFRLGVVYVLLGMALGIHMAASGDHSQAPTHAHLNLLGYVSFFLFGLFYKAYPLASEGRLPTVHFWLANLSVVGLTISLIILFLGNPEADPLAALFSLIALLAMALFAYIVFRATAKDK